jgi:hypothetical protein
MQTDDDGNPIDLRLVEAARTGSSVPIGAARYYGVRGGSGLNLPDMTGGVDDEDDDAAGRRRRKRANDGLEFGDFSEDDEDGGGADKENRAAKKTSESGGGGGGRAGGKSKSDGPSVPQQPSKKAKKAHVERAREDVRLRIRSVAGIDGSDAEEEEEEAEEAEEEDDDGSAEGSDMDGGVPRFRMCRAPDMAEMEAALHQKPQSAVNCFGCTHGRRGAGVTFENYKNIERTFNEKLSTTEAVSLARTLARQYENLRQKANKQRQDDEPEMPPWDAATIYDHFMFHMNDFTLRTSSRLKMLNTLIKYQYENGCWLTTGRGRRKRVVPSTAGIKILKDLITLEARLYAQKPRTAMFSSAGIGTNSDEVRSFIEKDKLAFHTINASQLKGSSVLSAASGGRGGTIHGAAKAK